MNRFDVCVVGAGPGGMLLAYLLAKKNISVLLLERTGQIAKTFRGEHINDEGEEILKRHQLYDDIKAYGLLKMEQLEYWHNGSLVKRLEPNTPNGHFGIHIPQAHLLKAILEKAEKLDTFQYCLNSNVTELIEENGRFIGVKVLRNNEEHQINAKLIIGADGRYSTIRRLANIKTEIRKHGYDLLWARIPAPPHWKPTIKMALIEGSQISLFTQVNNYIQIGWNIEPGSYPQLRKQPFSNLTNKLIQTFPELKPSIEANLKDWRDFVLLDVFSSRTEEWGKNGVLLIGDAVHTMTPTGAFGLNSAMKDADILASLLTRENLNTVDQFACANNRRKKIEEIQAIQIEKEQTFKDHFNL